MEDSADFDDTNGHAPENNEPTTTPLNKNRYTKIKYVSNTLSMGVGYTIAHLASSVSIATKIVPTSIGGAFIGGVASMCLSPQENGKVSFYERTKLLVVNTGSAVATLALADTLMTSAGYACWWVPPLVVGLTIAAPEILPPLWSKFGFWKNNATPVTQRNNDAEDENNSPTIGRYQNIN